MFIRINGVSTSNCACRNTRQRSGYTDTSFFLLLQITVLASPYSDPIQVTTTSMAQGMEQPEMLWVMGPVLAVVLIVIFVIAILLFKK